MAMLAEPRRKQKWSLNPRGKHWSDDSNKFGQKMLEKMGWSSGKGLGANLDGMTEHIRLKYKNDQAGVGFSLSDRDKEWTQHQEGFKELLQKLHNSKAAETTAAESKLSRMSLELKSKQSRARVHYQKFTRGKDVNKYSTKDLANIFGKKDLDEKSQEPEKVVQVKEEHEEPPSEPMGSSDTSHGVVTIKGGSITDYFKHKMPARGRKITTELPNDSEGESETYAGFGFSASQKQSEIPKKSLETLFSFVNPGLDIASPKETKNTLPVLDIASPKESKKTPRKRKSDFVVDNPALQFRDSTNEIEQTPKKRRNKFIFENGGLDLEYPQNDETESAISCSEDITKKKRKRKVKEYIPPVVDGFINEALNLESCHDEASSTSQFEVPRACLGLANNALDLTDETNGRKRVTFNETVEYDTDVASGKRKKKKGKSGGKLDKFEVDNEKMKRKKKKGRKDEIAESAFVNEAMDFDVVSQEADENAANERKSERVRRKRDRRMSNLETITEMLDEEKENSVEVVTLNESLVGEASEDFEVLNLGTPKRKQKKRKILQTEKLVGSQQNKNVPTTIDISEEDVELVEEILSRDSENSAEKSKKNEKHLEVKNAVKKSKRKKKDPLAREQKEMEVTELQVETVEKSKKENTTKKAISQDSKENIDMENVMTVEENLDKVESAKKRNKQKKEKKELEEEDDVEEKFEGDEKKTVEEEQLKSVTQSPCDANIKKSKRTFKALFARSPVVNFVGSNINEIKGYGMNLK